VIRLNKNKYALIVANKPSIARTKEICEPVQYSAVFWVKMSKYINVTVF